MATIQIEIPDQYVPRVLDAFATRGGWVDMETSGTKAAFAKAQLAAWVKKVVLDYERQQAEQAALQVVQQPAPIEVT
jgi:hypothetical protein